MYLCDQQFEKMGLNAIAIFLVSAFQVRDCSPIAIVIKMRSQYPKFKYGDRP
ncbi:hypothetical protein [Calothrix sp. NIES-3974]|uniref:hypothetical protein n=1 Tax=Calothrix sp. NIES-3974 TaxID=2005462 RepID=UPI0012FD779F|nr:hypothetical protein [Calothrix sp. NIES-3974]